MTWAKILFAALTLLGLASRAIAADPAVAYANRIGTNTIHYREGQIGAGDDRLHYVETGRGPLIILYHGFPSFWFAFFDQMEALKGQYRVVAVDGLGAGGSAKPTAEAPYRIDRLATQLDRLAQHLAPGERFTLVGHDWGAALAFAYAQAYPDRLHAVIGLSAPPYNLFLDLVARDTEQQARSGYMQRFRALTLPAIAQGGLPDRIWRQSYSGLVESGALTPEENELFGAALANPQALNGGMNWYRANILPFDRIDANVRWPKDNSKIKVPALLIWGDQDRTFVDQAWSRFVDYAERPTLVKLPRVGHWATMEKPELANAAIRSFLQQHVTPARRSPRPEATRRRR